MPKLRGALIGFGAVAEKAHVPAFAADPDFELAAIAESNPVRREAAKAALPKARLYESAEALYAGESALDFVDIATPPFLHAAQVLAALERKLHVLCEKPLALSFDDLARIKSAARSADRCVFTIHNWACSPQWLAIFELLPKIGPVKHASLFVLRSRPAASAVPGDWRTDAALSGGGILVDHGWHNLYLLHRLIPGNPKRLGARLEPAEGAEATARLSFEYPEATADLWMSWAAAGRANEAVVVGASGSLALRDGTLEILVGEHTETRRFTQKLSEGSAHRDWMARLLPEFSIAVKDPAWRGKNLDEAAFCLQTIQRAYQSARHGRSPVRETFQKLSGQAQFR